jgi:hypothetical protein
LAAAVASIRLTGGEIVNDSARAFYGFSYEGREETLSVGLERQGREWRIYHISFSEHN